VIGSLTLEEDVFGLDVAVDEVLFVDALEPLHDLHDDAGGLTQREGLTRQFGLVCEKVAHFAVLHKDDDEVGSCMEERVLVNSCS
jgi:hypothetical protein